MTQAKKPVINLPKPQKPKAKSSVASLPPPRGALYSRPSASTPAQRQKRRQQRTTGSITAAKKDKEGEILLFGTIGADWFGEGITAESFNKELKDFGEVDTIRLRINSGGGDVFEATAIYNMLVKHSAKVIVEIEGVAASAATLIAMAGDEIRISENAHWMIHAASGMAWGNAREIEQYLKLLNNADDLIRLTYNARTGIKDSELTEMMSFDNWMTAQEAFDHGFADAVDEAKKVSPHVTPDSAEDSIPRQPSSISPERLAAAASHLLALSASVLPKTTGGSPLPVSPPHKDSTMNAKLRAKCVAAGMVATLTDVEAVKWFDDNTDKVLNVAAPITPTKPDAGAPIVETKSGEIDEGKLLAAMEKADKVRSEKRKAWRKEVDANLSLAFGEKVDAKLKETCYDLQDDGIEAVRSKIQEARKEAEKVFDDGGIGIRLSPSQPRDRHMAALKCGVVMSCLNSGKLTAGQIEKHMPEKDRPAGWQDFAQMPLIKVAEESLLAGGMSYEYLRKLNVTQIAQSAMGFGRQAGIRAEALHTTGSLAEITRDAMNKSLLAGYEEAPQTWKNVGRQAPSVADFKDKHVVKLSAAPNLPVWPDNTVPEQAKLANEKEKYAVEARAETLSFSWRLIINDDRDALSRRPQLMGDAAGRTVNAVFWLQITANGTMADGQALFLETPTGNRKRSNYITGSASPSNTTIGSMRKLMRLMRGLNTPEQVESEDILNLTPAYIAGPAALEETILKQVLSGADPASSGNSAVHNTARTLTPVIEPLLDADSATAWYLFASPQRIDTVEVTFLQGQETPFTHEWMDDATLCQNFTIIQTFAAKAIDHRGIIKHKGAA